MAQGRGGCVHVIGGALWRHVGLTAYIVRRAVDAHSYLLSPRCSGWTRAAIEAPRPQPGEHLSMKTLQKTFLSENFLKFIRVRILCSIYSVYLSGDAHQREVGGVCIHGNNELIYCRQ